MRGRVVPLAAVCLTAWLAGAAAGQEPDLRELLGRLGQKPDAGKIDPKTGIYPGEVEAPLFRALDATGPVRCYPVAGFGPQQPCAAGWYAVEKDGMRHRHLWTLPPATRQAGWLEAEELIADRLKQVDREMERELARVATEQQRREIRREYEAIRAHARKNAEATLKEMEAELKQAEAVRRLGIDTREFMGFKPAPGGGALIVYGQVAEFSEFTPGRETFGLWAAGFSWHSEDADGPLGANGRHIAAPGYPGAVAYTEPARNAGQGRFKDSPRRARVFPFKDGKGNAVKGSYLVAFGHSGPNADRDLVVRLDNVEPLRPADQAPVKEPPRLRGTIKVDFDSHTWPVADQAGASLKKRFPEVSVSTHLLAPYRGGRTKMFVNGDVDVAGSCRPTTEQLVQACKQNGFTFTTVHVGWQAVAVVVHPKNTWAARLTVPQLRELCRPGGARLWSAVYPDWPKAAVRLYTPEKEGGAFEHFTEVVNGKLFAIRKDHKAFEEARDVVKSVAEDPHGLGFVPLDDYEAAKDRVRAAAVADKGPFVLPERKHVRDGSYSPLGEPLFVRVRDDALLRPEVQEFVRTMLAEHAEVAWPGFVHMTAEQLRAERARLEKAIEAAR